MRLISYHHNGHPGVGVMVDDQGFVALRNAAPICRRASRR